MIRRILAASMLAAPLTVVATTPAPAQAQGAYAETAQRLADLLIEREIVQANDKLWLAPMPETWGPSELFFLDELSAALIQRKVSLARDLTFVRPEVEADDLGKTLGLVRGLGANKILSYSLTADKAHAYVRVVSVPSGLVSVVDLVNLEKPVEVAKSRYYDQALGLQFSYLSGSGVTYRRWFENGWGYQVAGIPIVTLNQGGSPNGFLNLGAQVMMPIFRADRIRLFGMLGVGALYSIQQQSSSYVPSPAPGQTVDPSTGNVTTTSSRFEAGVAPGLGADFFVWENVALTGSIGYTFSYQQDNNVARGLGLSPGGTIGALIYW